MCSAVLDVTLQLPYKRTLHSAEYILDAKSIAISFHVTCLILRDHTSSALHLLFLELQLSYAGCIHSRFCVLQSSRSRKSFEYFWVLRGQTFLEVGLDNAYI